MSKKLISLLAVAMFTAVLYTGCAKPPTELQNQAQQALDAAKAEGADMYAKDAYDKAASTLSEGNGLVDSKDYKGAAEKYQAALDGANAAKAAAPAAKAAMAKDVTAMLDQISASLDGCAKSLDAGGKKMKKDDKEKYTMAIADGKKAVEGLRASAAADPMKAKADATALAAKCKATDDEMQAAMAPPAKAAKGGKEMKAGGKDAKAPAKTNAEKKSPAGDKKPAGKK